MNEHDRLLWAFFAEYYDDWICNYPGGDDEDVTVSARTVRALAEVFGRDLLKHFLRRWQAEGSVVVLGPMEELAASKPCVRLLDYVSKITTTPPQ